MTNNNYAILLTLCAFLSLSFGLRAQTSEGALSTYTQAEENYRIGRFEETDSIIQANLGGYDTPALRAGAYRLLSLCALWKGNEAEARRWAGLMFEANPYYSVTVHDPARFVDMVEALKQGGAKVSTASQQAETLDEVPVPVTLITGDMIKASGARTLQDLLLLYVPGMTLVESSEQNVAMHGVYSAGQEKILILLDGHRLNSHVTNSEAPDYRTSLNKVKQIEVLRGPASSLYGNVALTAVVNIITKSGHELDGTHLEVGAGSNHSFNAELNIGKEGIDMGYALWMSFYSSKGERRSVGPNDELFWGRDPREGKLYIDGYNQLPAFDLGVKANWKELTTMITVQHSKRVTPYTTLLSPMLYDYDRYRTLDGQRPGRSRLAVHLNLGWTKSWGAWSLKADLWGDYEKTDRYEIVADTISSMDEAYNVADVAGKHLIDSLARDLIVRRGLTPYVQQIIQQNPGMSTDSLMMNLLGTIILKQGIYWRQKWTAYTLGMGIQAQWAFSSGDALRGTLLGGFQTERYTMDDNMMMLGDGFEHVFLTMSDKSNVLQLGEEWVFSPFLQAKCVWWEKLIVNAGLRYDWKHRWDGMNVTALAPRVSVIYRFTPQLNLKLSYSRSFVDAPYYYRANRMSLYEGGERLKAETMDAVQLNLRWATPVRGLNVDMNVFYNDARDMINLSSWYDRFTNGKMRAMGIDGTVGYDRGRFMARVGFSWLNILSCMNGNISIFREKEVLNVPTFSATAMGAWRVMDNRAGNLLLHANAIFYSRQNAALVATGIYKGGESNIIQDPYFIDARCTVGLGLNYAWGPLELSLDCYNLFNTRYVQGGSSPVPLPQQGRSLYGKLGYKF